MRKKNLSVKVAALAMSGTLAMAPMTVRAEEVAAAPAATSGTPATTPASGTGSTGSGATASAGTVTPAAVSTAAGTATPAAPVTVSEPAADPGTTAPNNVDTVVPDDNYQGTEISAEAGVNLGFFTLPVANVDAKISPKDADEKGEQTIAGSHSGVENNELTQLKNKDVVMQGDLSIKKRIVPKILIQRQQLLMM